MKQTKGAGASRRGRRRVLNAAAVVTTGVALVLTIGRGSAENGGDAWPPGSVEFTRTDAEIARQLLDSVNGANAVVCAAIDRAFSGGYWGGARYGVQPDAFAPPEAVETAHWIGKRRTDAAVVDVVRPGLASSDACTRRVAVRILGNVDARLDQLLARELESPVLTTRVAAILVLGYAEQRSSVARLRELLADRERAVRIAAVWALGRIEDESASALIIDMLKRDDDAEVRSTAAWALGQIHN